MRGDMKTWSSLISRMYMRLASPYNPPKLAPVLAFSIWLSAFSKMLMADCYSLTATWLPKRHRVGPSASLDEYRTTNCCESVSQGRSHVNFVRGLVPNYFVRPE